MSSSAGCPLNVSQWECGSNLLYIRAWKQDCPETPLEPRWWEGVKMKSRFLRMYLSSMVIRTWLEASRPNRTLPFLIFLMPGSLTWKLAIKSNLFYTHWKRSAFFFPLGLPWNGIQLKIKAKQQFSFLKNDEKKMKKYHSCCKASSQRNCSCSWGLISVFP